MVDSALFRPAIRELLPEALRWLERMVSINSFTANRPGVNAVGQLTAECFGALGFQAETVPATCPDWGNHLVLRRPAPAGVSIALVTHLDTVFPPEEELRNDFRWRVEGTRIYGPGTNDIKGGTMLAWLTLAALQRVVPKAFNAIDWRVFCNAAEETFATDFGDLVRSSLAPGTRAALVFEGEGHDDRGARRLVISRKGRAAWRIRVAGHGAHAGVDHQRGANAIVQLAELLTRVAGWTDYARDLTFNVGRVEAGTVLNRVPHEAMAEGEFRAFQPGIFLQARAALLALSGPGTVQTPRDGHPCVIQAEILSENRPWPRNESTDQLFAHWQQTGRSIGQEILPESRGGLSDGNWIWDAVPTLDGLGPWGENSHCSEWSEDGSKRPEFVDTSSFEPKTLLNAMAIVGLIEGAGIRIP